MNYRIAVYVPESHVGAVKGEMFEAGAGQIGNYDCCAWQVKGTGQFRGLEGSNPAIGESGQVETVEEYRVEIICAGDKLGPVIEALRAAHPYEEPAFDVWQLIDPDNL